MSTGTNDTGKPNRLMRNILRLHRKGFRFFLKWSRNARRWIVPLLYIIPACKEAATCDYMGSIASAMAPCRSSEYSFESYSRSKAYFYIHRGPSGPRRIAPTTCLTYLVLHFCLFFLLLGSVNLVVHLWIVNCNCDSQLRRTQRAEYWQMNELH